jgi:hypothetical protein
MRHEYLSHDEKMQILCAYLSGGGKREFDNIEHLCQQIAVQFVISIEREKTPRSHVPTADPVDLGGVPYQPTGT